MIEQIKISRVPDSRYHISYVDSKGQEKNTSNVPESSYSNVMGLLSYIDSLQTEEERLIIELNEQIAVKEQEVRDSLLIQDTLNDEREALIIEKNSIVQKIMETSLTEVQMLQLIDVYPAWSPIPDAGDGRYLIGEKVKYLGKLYNVIGQHIPQVDWMPTVALSLFTEVKPPSVIAQFVQPFGGSGTYTLGTKVIFEGKTYENIHTAQPLNVWSPTALPSGWKLI